MKRRKLMAITFVVSLVVSASAGAGVFIDDEEIVFKITYPNAVNVYLVGDFNGWNPTIDKMLKSGDSFEIRLFLLPGRYSYRFIVDGKSITDPDNSFLDDKGNSVFFLSEVNGKLKLDFKRIRRAAGGKARGTTVGTRYTVTYDGWRKGLFGRAAFNGSVDSGILLDATIGLKGVRENGDSIDGRVLLLEALAKYSFSDLNIGAFYRSDVLGLGDPLELFSSVAAPFDYPLGLFSRGVLLEHDGLPFGVKGKVFYADRFDDYTPRLEGISEGKDCRSFSFLTDYLDSDIIGVKLSAGGRMLKLDYLFRSDKRPIAREGLVEYAEGTYYRAYEKMIAHGVRAELFGDEGSTVEVEYLGGLTRLSIFERSLDAGLSYDDYGAELKCKRGGRFFVAYKLRRDGLRSSVAVKKTVIESGDREGRFKRESEASSLGFKTEYTHESWRLSVDTELMHFSSLQGAKSYFLRGNNFWLDGDIVDLGVIPFLHRNDLYRVKAEFSYGGDSTSIHRYPGVRDLTIAFHSTGDFVRGGDFTNEVVLSKEFSFSPLVNFMFDVRYVSYSIGDRRESLFDPYLSYYMKIGSRCRFAVGAGVNPYAFDDLTFMYIPFGRERFLVEHGAMDDLSSGSEAELMDRLMSAENKMADEMSIQFELSFSF